MKNENGAYIKQFFRDYRLLRIRSIYTGKEIERLKNCGPRYIKAMEYSDMPHSTMVSNTETEFTHMLKLEETHQDMQNQLHEASYLLQMLSIDNAKQASILRLFYLEGQMVNDIAKKLELTPEHTSTLKKKGEQNLEAVLLGKFKTNFKILVNFNNS